MNKQVDTDFFDKVEDGRRLFAAPLYAQWRFPSFNKSENVINAYYSFNNTTLHLVFHRFLKYPFYYDAIGVTGTNTLGEVEVHSNSCHAALFEFTEYMRGAFVSAQSGIQPTLKNADLYMQKVFAECGWELRRSSRGDFSGDEQNC